MTRSLQTANWGWLAYWAREDVGRYERLVTKRLAFVTRYSSITLTEALESDTSWLMLFASCLGEIVREENSPRPMRGDDD